MFLIIHRSIFKHYAVICREISKISSVNFKQIINSRFKIRSATDYLWTLPGTMLKL